MVYRLALLRFCSRYQKTGTIERNKKLGENMNEELITKIEISKHEKGYHVDIFSPSHANNSFDCRNKKEVTEKIISSLQF